MMQKAATDNVVCIACGTDVRSEALFCYNCGGAVAVQSEAAADAIGESESEERVFASPPEKIVSPTASGTPDANGAAAVKSEPKPLSAAMLRRKRAYNRQPVEVVWKEPARPSVAFVIISVVFTIFAALLLAAALYLK